MSLRDILSDEEIHALLKEDKTLVPVDEVIFPIEITGTPEQIVKFLTFTQSESVSEAVSINAENGLNSILSIKVNLVISEFKISIKFPPPLA